MNGRIRTMLAVIAPGILVAATGVGAGDILTAALGGSAVGLALLWAAVAGAVLKWVLNEGIARWQMATETTIIAGWQQHLGRWFAWLFLLYLIAWTFFTGGALITACGVAGHAVLPLSPTPLVSKILWGLSHALAGYLLVRIGGFALFEKMMSAFIVVMFIAVLITATLIAPDWWEIAQHILVPRIPAGGLTWTLGVLGGVGGTVTLLSYGYWIREAGRTGIAGLRTSRIDLAAGYTLTALFGVCMILIGTNVTVSGSGVNVAPLLAAQLETTLGTAGKWLFLIGFWGAVFSSLLGVWQSVPYMFADFMVLNRDNLLRPGIQPDTVREKAYRTYLAVITLLPIPILWFSVQKAQLIYAVTGAFFMPVLAGTLLYLNNWKLRDRTGFRNGVLVNAALIVTMVFFLYAGVSKVISLLRPMLSG